MIAKYVLKGFTQKYIAKELNLSHRTVESYINNLKLKCDCFDSSSLKEYLCNIIPFHH